MSYDEALEIFALLFICLFSYFMFWPRQKGRETSRVYEGFWLCISARAGVRSSKRKDFHDFLEAVS